FWLAGTGCCADRTGGGTIVAVALRGDEGSWFGGRVIGDPARAEGAGDDAGEERSQRCARYRPADTAGLVPTGSLQVDWCAGDAGGADGPQAGAVEAFGCLEQCAGDFAGLWAQSRPSHEPEVRRTGRGPGGQPCEPSPDRRGAAVCACGAVARTEGF